MNAMIDWHKPARTYSVQPDGRARLRVVVVVGDDDAHAVTPWHTTDEPMRLSALEIARDCDIPAGEVVGREYTATGDRDALHDFRLVHDPRV